MLESKTNIINVRGAQDHIVHTAAEFFKQTIHFLLLSATTSIQDTITGNRDKKAIGHMPPCNFQYLYVHEERCQSIGEGESYIYRSTYLPRESNLHFFKFITFTVYKSC